MEEKKTKEPFSGLAVLRCRAPAGAFPRTARRRGGCVQGESESFGREEKEETAKKKRKTPPFRRFRLEGGSGK